MKMDLELKKAIKLLRIITKEAAKREISRAKLNLSSAFLLMDSLKIHKAMIHKLQNLLKSSDKC
jgi:hypothetical protein